VFNEIKKILLRLRRTNGMINLTLLEGLIKELRNKLDVELVAFKTHSESTSESLADFNFSKDQNAIGKTAQMMLIYATHDIKLPPAILKQQKLVLRDFSLLHPIKIMEALDEEHFEREENAMNRKLSLQRNKDKEEVKVKFA
jgi:hypothetical protein